MSFAEDEEILQVFLVEAGEILEKLSSQLVELENKPDDVELLNSIFRGFHTVKGGAGFLQLDAMVQCCHITENLFDKLRTRSILVTSELMDVTLQALDAINQMYSDLQNKQPARFAPPSLIDALGRLAAGQPAYAEAAANVKAVASAAPQPVVEQAAPMNSVISDDDFANFIDAIQEVPAKSSDNESSAAVAASSSGNDEITDDEFESMLDQLQGKGNAANAPKVEAAPAPVDMVITPTQHSAGIDLFDLDEPVAMVETLSAFGAGDSDNISDDEFEAMLDQLHGNGKVPSGNAFGAAVKEPVKAAVHDDVPATPIAPLAPPVYVAAPAVQLAKVENIADHRVDTARTSASPAPTPTSSGDNAGTDSTVRVDTQRLDDIMNLVGELVLVRNRLVRLGLNSTDEAMAKAVSNLDVVTADLQSSVMKTRMQPIKKVFGRFPRVVRDLARTLKKEVNLELVGEETDLDKNLVEALADPLVHLVRNAVDHGVEMPDERARRGKPRTGNIILAAAQEGDHILLTITDDGNGMDPDMLRRKAVEKGLYDVESAARLSDRECFELIFAPGFSTKQEISDISGRGVGMDVVKTKIAQLNGSIEISSKPGEGSRIAIKVPLTLAIMPTLMVMLGEQTFALPLVSVNEIFHLDLKKTNVVDGQEVVIVRNKALPLFHLKRWLVNSAAHDVSDSAHVVIVTVGSQRVGFVVDQLIGQEEVVIKPLGKMLQGTPGMAGATITGDGAIALILDVPSMLNRYVG
jgi:two-component system chemotaxis sensor kinase CheA